MPYVSVSFIRLSPKMGYFVCHLKNTSSTPKSASAKLSDDMNHHWIDPLVILVDGRYYIIVFQTVLFHF